MRIIAKKPLREFWEIHPDAEKPLRAWHKEVEKEDWSKPQDLTARYPKASTIGDNRAVFRIRQGRFRLVVKINYRAKLVFIRFIDTHDEYDKIDAKTI